MVYLGLVSFCDQHTHNTSEHNPKKDTNANKHLADDNWSHLAVSTSHKTAVSTNVQGLNMQYVLQWFFVPHTHTLSCWLIFQATLVKKKVKLSGFVIQHVVLISWWSFKWTHPFTQESPPPQYQTTKDHFPFSVHFILMFWPKWQWALKVFAFKTAKQSLLVTIIENFASGYLKMNILSLFTLPKPLWLSFLSVEHKRRHFKECLKPYSDATIFVKYYVWVSILITWRLRFSCTNSDGN